MDCIQKAKEAFVYKMRESVDLHYANIASELTLFDRLSPIDRARHAIVFSIVSPKCPIVKNATITPLLVNAVMHNATLEDLLSIFSEVGVGLQNMKAARIMANAEYIRTLTTATIDRDVMSTLSGLSMKTASMAMALYDQNAEVYTLDTHMIRWAREVAGLTPEPGTHACSNAKRYRQLESFLIDIAKEHCADVPVFLTQWAIWNDAGFNGEHQIHLPIFGIVE